MDDLNTETPNRRNTAAPLSHDSTGRFSRRGKVRVINPKKIAFFENALIVLYITFLLATDFILFSGSGNIVVFRNSFLPIPEILLVMFFFLLLASITIYLLRGWPVLKNSLAAAVTFGLIFVLYRQFSTVQQILEIGGTIIPSYLAIGAGFAIVCFGILFYGNFFVRLLLMVAAGTLFFHVYSAYIGHRNQPEFLESYKSDSLGEGEGENKRFIYFLFPNLSSYSYLTTLKNNNEALRTKKIMQGFYQKNGFIVYPKAFTPEQTFLDNMVRALNPESESSSKEHILKTRLLSEYWRFYNIRREYIFLKDNSLFDRFKQEGYKISAYKSRDFDMCHKDHQINVDRCIEKVNQPVNIYDIRLSTMSKVNILLMEWISSMRIINNLSAVFSFLSRFFDLHKAPMVGIDYSNLYVVNSVKTFDILLQNIKEDKGKQAYFVFVDLPSNMYIYNEFCQVKNTDEWYDISSLPWITADLSEQRGKAYLQQTRCLYGEMEYFMQQLQKADLLKDTTIVIQGTSSVNNFKPIQNEDFIQDFISTRLVSMAIYDGQNTKDKLDWRLCSTNQLLRSYLDNENRCSKDSDFGVHDKVITDLNRQLVALAMNIDNDVRPNFEKWYESWLVVNKDKEDRHPVWLEKVNQEEEPPAAENASANKTDESDKTAEAENKAILVIEKNSATVENEAEKIKPTAPAAANTDTAPLDNQSAQPEIKVNEQADNITAASAPEEEIPPANQETQNEQDDDSAFGL